MTDKTTEAIEMSLKLARIKFLVVGQSKSIVDVAIADLGRLHWPLLTAR